MTAELSKKYYAGDTAIPNSGRSDDLVGEDWTWIKEYINIRQEMSLGFEQIPLP